MTESRFFDFRPFGPRDPAEHHRAATPLELFFDLVLVIAIAATAAGLHHAIAENHAASGIATFLFAFFAAWWAWMNYVWYASAYDNDGPIYRLLTLLIMAGALVLAAGIPGFYEGLNISLGIVGYCIMRLGMVALWLIAARNDPAHATTARRYAGGIFAVQVGWVALLVLREPLGAAFMPLIVLGIVVEMAIPAYAERGGMTPWHRHHISERYGLLTIIVLGEVMLSTTKALATAGGDLVATSPLVHIALAALAIGSSMWWLYFTRDEHLTSTSIGRALLWGYGHFLIFASVAAVGAGFGVLVDVVAHNAHASLRTGDMAVAIPLAVYLLALWFVRDRYNLTGAGAFVLPAFAVAILIAGCFLPAALELVALLAVLSVPARSIVLNRQRLAAGQEASAAQQA